VNYRCSKNRHAQRVSAAKCRGRLHHSKNFQNICLKKYDALYTTATAATKKKMSQQMPYMISSRSVANDASLSVSESKLIYRILISADNKVKGIWLFTQQQLVTVSVRHTQDILLMWRVLHLWGKRRKGKWGAWNNHFVRNFVECSPILQILSSANWMINL